MGYMGILVYSIIYPKPYSIYLRGKANGLVSVKGLGFNSIES